MPRVSWRQVSELADSVRAIAGTFPDNSEAHKILDDLSDFEAAWERGDSHVNELYAIRDRLNELVTMRLFRSEVQPPLVERSVCITLYGSKAFDRALAAALAMDEVIPGRTVNVTLVDNTTVQDASLTGVRYTFRAVFAGN